MDCMCGHVIDGNPSDHICGIGDLTVQAKKLQRQMKTVQEKLLSSHSIEERNSLLSTPDQKNETPLVYPRIITSVWVAHWDTNDDHVTIGIYSSEDLAHKAADEFDKSVDYGDTDVDEYKIDETKNRYPWS